MTGGIRPGEGTGGASGRLQRPRLDVRGGMTGTTAAGEETGRTSGTGRRLDKVRGGFDAGVTAGWLR